MKKFTESKRYKLFAKKWDKLTDEQKETYFGKSGFFSGMPKGEIIKVKVKRKRKEKKPPPKGFFD